MAYKFDEKGLSVNDNGNSKSTEKQTNLTNGSISSADIQIDKTKYVFDHNGKIVGVESDTPVTNIVGKSNIVPVEDNSDKISQVDDNNASVNIVNQDISGSAIVTKPTDKKYAGVNGSSVNYYTDPYFQNILHHSGLYQRSQLGLYSKTHRFGNINYYGAISTGREFLFFTKPDLHIVQRNAKTGAIENKLNSALEGIPFWIDLFYSRKDAIALLQSSYGTNSVPKADPFNHLFQNNCISNLELQSLQAEMIDTPQNIYGVNFKYRGSSESSDDGPEFSLEFKDTRWLDIYTVFKAYEEYETLKHHGVIRPHIDYIMNKIVHDQFAVYKFIVDEDMESIIYYGKMYGVTPKSLPRDVFGNPNFDNGLSYSIDFAAAFYEDMNPNIIADFNALAKPWYDSQKYNIGVYNANLDRVDRRAATAAYIVKDNSSPVAKLSTAGYVYKLKWKGSDVV